MGSREGLQPLDYHFARLSHALIIIHTSCNQCLHHRENVFYAVRYFSHQYNLILACLLQCAGNVVDLPYPR
jgi:hypothetical protein